MDICRTLLQAIAAGVPLDDILGIDTTENPFGRRLTRLVRLGLVEIDDFDEMRLTEEGERVLAYIAPEGQWAFLCAAVREADEAASISAFEVLASRIVAHVPAPMPEVREFSIV